MTLPILVNDHSLSIDQFEKQYESKVVFWLVDQKKYCRREAEALSTLILQYLKSHYCPKKPYPLAVIWQIIHKFTQQELSQTITLMGKNFGLTKTAFEEMLTELEQGRDDLYEQVFLKHFDDCQAYLRTNYQASQADAYDATMEAMLEFMKRLRAGKIEYGNLRFLFTRMAGQIYWKWIKKEKQKGELLDLRLGEGPSVPEPDTLKALHQAWTGLCQDCERLLRQFYYDGIALKEIAAEMRKPAATLRKQKQRCVEKLRKLFAQHYQG